MSKKSPPFIWAEDDQPDKWASDDESAIRHGTSKASVERWAEKYDDVPPAVYFGRLKKRSCHGWNEFDRRRMAESLAAAAAANAPADPAAASLIGHNGGPPLETGETPKGRCGRPPGSKNKKRTTEPVPIPAPPIKRGRGRPRKYPLPATGC